ncbi:MAG TPA: VWA domain-containing protein [Candidatus Binatia bacterium]|jgi:Ca-activated chloride channel family protein|nr:VWA domain-containing protein [Candidatus Binatia bacterium]
MEMPHTTPTRRRLLAAGVLLGLTALAGAASRSREATPPPTNTALRFTGTGSGLVTFTGQLDRAAVRTGGDGLVRMELLLGAKNFIEQARRRRPADIVVVLDRSGSMEGDKLVHARAAVAELIQQLDPRDRFALISYADDAEMTIPLAAVSPEARSGWLTTVAGLGTLGGTNMSSGLDLALSAMQASGAAGRVARTILISDGLANQGDSSPEGLVARARRVARSEWALTTVGVGSDFNEYLMTALADAGTGNYYFVERATDLGDVFAREFGTASTTVASAVEVEIAPAAGVRVVDAGGYPLETTGDGHVVFRPGTLFAGQERRIWVTLAVPQDAVGERDLGRFALAYKDGDTARRVAFAETPRVACVADDDAFFAGVDTQTWERAVVVEEFNKMQDTVARQVAAGKRDEAAATVKKFRTDTGKLNDRLRSKDVAQKLESLGALEARVDDAFQGADQKGKQNRLSKSGSAAAYDARRPGGKY